jgi:hypothetical protein
VLNLLRRIADHASHCPICGSYASVPHHPDCDLAWHLELLELDALNGERRPFASSSAELKEPEPAGRSSAVERRLRSLVAEAATLDKLGEG